MIQHWFNIGGLAIDFAGAMLLAREWWIALGSEQREDEFLERQRREDELLRPSPLAQQQQPNPSHAVFERMREQQRFTHRNQRLHSARGMRRAWFMTALGLIAGGFLMQILGSWPGGLPWLGE
jgi:hypothetical protein